MTNEFTNVRKRTMNYRLLGDSGLRVSEIVLGTMTFGKEWGWGAEKEESNSIFKKYIESGGNFIDTANRYTEGRSEEYVGEFVNEMQIRDEVVIATKYSLFTKANRINDGGNHRKNMMQSVEQSLKRLNTDYIDLFYLHAWDHSTKCDEVMRAFDDLVSQGKVLYIGISDTPAWIVSRCNTIAELRGWSKFIALQIEYSLLMRDGERDLLPMAKELGIGITAWAPLAGGALTGKYLQQNDDAKRLAADNKRLSDRNTTILKKVVEIAQENNCSPGHIALQWIHTQQQQILPIIGARTLEQFNDNLQYLNGTLSPEQFNELNEVSAIEKGFPHDFLAAPYVQTLLFGGFENKISR